jgi:hypothetical protein
MLKKLKKLKKAKQICILFPAITLNVALSSAGQTTEPFEVRRAEAVFEELPVLNASEILRPEILAGSHHKVREPIPTCFGANQFTIDSDFGVFEAKGNEMRRALLATRGFHVYSTRHFSSRELLVVSHKRIPPSSAFSFRPRSIPFGNRRSLCTRPPPRTT